MNRGIDPLLLPYTYTPQVALWVFYYTCNIIESIILKMCEKSKFVLWQPRYYNLLTEKKDMKIHVFENVLLDDIVLRNFTLSNLIILVENLTRRKRGFGIFLIGHYASDNGNKTIVGKY